MMPNSKPERDPSVVPSKRELLASLRAVRKAIEDEQYTSEENGRMENAILEQLRVWYTK